MKAKFISLDDIVLEAETEEEKILITHFYQNSKSIKLDDWIFDVDYNEKITKFTISSELDIEFFAKERGIGI